MAFFYLFRKGLSMNSIARDFTFDQIDSGELTKWLKDKEYDYSESIKTKNGIRCVLHTTTPDSSIEYFKETKEMKDADKQLVAWYSMPPLLEQDVELWHRLLEPSDLHN